MGSGCMNLLVSAHMGDFKAENSTADIIHLLEELASYAVEAGENSDFGFNKHLLKVINYDMDSVKAMFNSSTATSQKPSSSSVVCRLLSPLAMPTLIKDRDEALSIQVEFMTSRPKQTVLRSIPLAVPPPTDCRSLERAAKKPHFFHQMFSNFKINKKLKVLPT